jgi:peroxiredoxin
MAPERPEAAADPRQGGPAPDFTLPSADGGQVALRDFRGRWAVLVFLRYLG